MAEFIIAETITGATEGGLADNPNDKGGFTYAGIASHFWPNFPGWALIRDTVSKCGGDFHRANLLLKANPQMKQYIHDFYKANFWEVNALGSLSDQQLANNAYDCGVNCGTGIAAIFLQEAYNFIKPGSLHVDGKIGAMTVAAVNSGHAEIIFNEYNALRKQRYLNIIAKNPSQAQFKRSWLGRLLAYQK